MLPLRRSVRADLEPVDAGHQHVEHHRVRLGLGLEPLERLRAVLGELDLVALELERAPQRLAHGPFVVDHQDLHERIVAPEAERRVRTPCTAASLRELLGDLHVVLKGALEDRRRHRSRDPPKPLCDERPRSGGVFCFLRDFLAAFQAALSRRLLSWPTDIRLKGTSLMPRRSRPTLIVASLLAAACLGAGGGAVAVRDAPRQRHQHRRQAGDGAAGRPGLRLRRCRSTRSTAAPTAASSRSPSPRPPPGRNSAAAAARPRHRARAGSTTPTATSSRTTTWSTAPPRSRSASGTARPTRPRSSAPTSRPTSP